MRGARAIVVAGMLALACGACATAAVERAGWAMTQPGALAPDPSMKFGELRNGFRWMAAPTGTQSGEGRVSLRLVLMAGSRHEQAGAEGAAHLLEHMAFRGTRRFADGDIQRRLGALGLAPGRDINAATGQDATVYRIDLPRGDADAMFAALSVLREIASEMTLDPAMLDAERGVVLAEERARAGPDAELAEAIDRARLGDHPHARPIIGRRGSIEHIGAGDLRRFYDAWYRPERAVLIVAGDIDGEALQAVIANQFGDWRGKGVAGVDPPPAALQLRPAVEAPEERGTGETVVLVDWPGAFAQRRATEADRRAQLVDMLWATALNERLPTLLEQAGRPARSASLSVNRTAGVWEAVTASAAGVLDPARTAAILTEAARQAATFGIDADELARAKELQLAAARRASFGFAQSAPARADRLVDQLLLDGSAFQSPQQERALLERLAPGVTLEEANAALRKRLGGAAHVLVSGGTAERDALRASVSSAVEQAMAIPAAPYTGRALPDWPYADFGAPGAVVERQHVADLDVTLVKFANGLDLSIRPMKAEAGRARVTLAFGDGRAGLPREAHTAAEMGLTVWAQGGLGKLSRTQQARLLAMDGVGLSAAMADDAYLLRATTHASSMRRQLELMAAMMSDPGYRTDEWERFLRAAEEADTAAASTPVRVLTQALPGLLRSGDVRWTPSTAQERAAWKAEDAVAFIAPVVANAPMELRIVGDVDVEAVIADVAATLGALPLRVKVKPDDAIRRARFPDAAGVIVVPHEGRADQAALTIAWPVGRDLLADPKAYRVARVLAQLLQDRATLHFRTGESTTYAPTGSAVFSRTSPGFGYIALSLELPPERIDEAMGVIDTLARGLAEKPPTAEELNWVLNPQTLQAGQERRESLAFWSINLARAHQDGRPLDYIRTHESGHAAITPQDVQAAAAEWLHADRALRVKSVARD